jgi:hypothetical protein
MYSKQSVFIHNNNNNLKTNSTKILDKKSEIKLNLKYDLNRNDKNFKLFIP